MGTDKVRYLVFVCGRYRWRPTKSMRAVGFRIINLSPGVLINNRRYPAANDIARALELNAAWDRHRRGLPDSPACSAIQRFPRGSVGAGFLRAVALREAERKSRGLDWTAEQHSRDDWPRAWRWIEPLFGDCDPQSISAEQVLDLRLLVAAKVSESEAHRVIKVWRALWKKLAVLGFCDAARDPSLMFANSAPAPRQDVWSEGEAVRIIKSAWRKGFRGLGTLLAVAWDSQLSPVDARSLRAHDMRRDPVGVWFDVARAKTGRAALATLSKRAAYLVDAYLSQLAAKPVGAATVFRNRSGVPIARTRLATISGPYVPWFLVPRKHASSQTFAGQERWRPFPAMLPPPSSRRRWRTHCRRRTGSTEPMRRRGSPTCAMSMRQGSGGEPGYGNKNRTKVSYRRTKSVIAPFRKKLSD